VKQAGLAADVKLTHEPREDALLENSVHGGDGPLLLVELEV
jgi:hypothetical protein